MTLQCGNIPEKAQLEYFVTTSLGKDWHVLLFVDIEYLCWILSTMGNGSKITTSSLPFRMVHSNVDMLPVFRCFREI